MTQKQDFTPFTKANHHLANAKHRFQLQKRSLGNVSSQRANGKAASAKARKPSFFHLSCFDKQRGYPVECQLLKKPDELILHQAS